MAPPPSQTPPPDPFSDEPAPPPGSAPIPDTTSPVALTEESAVDGDTAFARMAEPPTPRVELFDVIDEATAPHSSTAAALLVLEADRASRGAQSKALQSLGLVPELVELVELEAAVAAPEARNELAVRAARLAWETRGDAELVARLLDGVEHPAADALQPDMALDALDGSTAAALSARTEAALSTEPKDPARLAALGAAWLLRGDAARAVPLLAGAGAAGRDDLALALALAGRFADLVAQLGPVEKVENAENVEDIESALAAAAIAQDRLGDLNAAREHLRRALKLAAASGEGALDDPYLVERQLELDVDAPEALRRKIDALAAEPAALAERSAAQYLLAARLGPNLESASLLASLSEPGADDPDFGRFGSVLVQLLRAGVEATLGDVRAAASSWQTRASQIGVARWARALQRRAAELIEARLGDAAEAEAMQARLLAEDPVSTAAAGAVARLRLARRDLAGLGEALVTHGRAQLALHGSDRGALRRAARAFEAQARASGPHLQAVPGRIGTGVHAGERTSLATTIHVVERWREVVGGAASTSDFEVLSALARAARRAGDAGALVEIYRQRIAAADSAIAEVLRSVASALALDVGLLEEAKAFAHDAAPDDLLALVVRARAAQLAATAEAAPEEADALAAAATLASAPAVRARLLRRLAEVRRDRLGDADAAADTLEKALALQPHDPGTLHAYARLRGDAGRWQEAAEHTERAAAAAAAGGAAAVLVPSLAPAALLFEAGRIYLEHLGDEARAADAWRRALALDPTARDALLALGELHRKVGDHAALADVLGRLAALEPDRGAGSSLHLAEAEAALASGAPNAIDQAIGAFEQALRLDPDSRAALDGLWGVCRRENRWEVLASVLGADARLEASPLAQAALAEAYEKLGRSGDLIAAREREVLLLEQRGDLPALGRAARSLAELCERLGDLDGAARAWHRADDVNEEDPTAARALQRIYEARGRHADLAAAIERELLRMGASFNRRDPLFRTTTDMLRIMPKKIDEARALALWMRLATIRRANLQKPADAADAYEEALRIDPEQADALAALGELYSQLNRPADLLRVLDLRAGAIKAPAERVAVLVQIAEQREKLGDSDGALEALREAFQLDPTSRAAFTAYERACYRRERWQEALTLYERAIHVVEVEKHRAYRLADLFSRRANVELTYLGDTGAAAKSYERLLELDAESDAAQSALERIYGGRNDWARLLWVYETREKKLRDDARRADVLRRAARVAAAELRDAPRAIALYQRLHAADPTDTEALDALERHYDETHDHARLLDVLRMRTALTTGGDEAIALYLRIASVCEEGLSDIDQAIDAYRKILDIAPQHREALDALARLYEGTERWAELVDVSRRQIRIINDRQQKALIYFRCGSVMELKFGKDDDAIRYYDAAIKTSPSCLPALHGLRDLYLRREDWARVIETLEREARIWSEEKERAGVLAHIGQIYRDKLGDAERAIHYFENALGVDRECLPANRALFELYFARGEHARALPLGAVLTQKVMRDGDPAERSEFYRKRAIVARATGDLRGAAESLVVGLEIRPENLDVLDELVSLCRAEAEVYDFAGTFSQLARIYRKRDGGESPVPGSTSARLLARVLVAQASLAERALDIEGAENLLLEAQRLAADDYPVVEAQASLQLRLRRNDAAALALEDFIARTTDRATRRAARLRLAEVYGDVVMAPERSLRVLQSLVSEEPQLAAGWFRLAQEQYLLGRFADAEKTCERLIEIAAAPGQTAPPEDLARYYDYLGRIAEAQGDGGAAARSYRRAVDLDPGYPPPILALARRFAAAGDLAQGVTLLEGALANLDSSTQAAPATAAQLTRGLARLHVSYGDRREAIRLLSLLVEKNADPGAEDDRVQLAELHLAAGDLTAARELLRSVVTRNVRSAPAYRVFMRVFEKAGLAERSARVAGILRLIGYADYSDSTLRTFVAQARRGTISDELRATRLLPPSARGVWADAFEVLREGLEAVFPPPPPQADVPLPREASFSASLSEVRRLYGVDAVVRLARGVAGGVMAYEAPRPTVVMEAALAERSDGERRFLLGRALETLRAGTSLLFRLRSSDLVEVARLSAELLRPPAERDPQAEAFFQTLGRKSQRATERLVGAQPEQSFDAWLGAVGVAADRAGLLACDDVAAAARSLARLGGEELAVTEEGAVLLGQVPGAEELIRFFLSDAYDDLRAALETTSR